MSHSLIHLGLVMLMTPVVILAQPEKPSMLVYDSPADGSVTYHYPQSTTYRLPTWNDAPTVDGIVESTWKQGLHASQFTVLRTQAIDKALAMAGGGDSGEYLDQTLIPEAQTQAWLGMDEKHLFVAVTCEEPQPDQIVTLKGAKRDAPIFQGDVIELFIADPAQPDEDYYHVIVDPRGVLEDMTHRRRTDPTTGKVRLEENAEWNPKVTVATRVTDHNWSLELAIPWADLNVDPKQDTSVLLNLARHRAIRHEYSSWAPSNTGFHEPHHWHRLSLGDSACSPVAIESIAVPRIGLGLNPVQLITRAQGNFDIQVAVRTQWLDGHGQNLAQQTHTITWPGKTTLPLTLPSTDAVALRLTLLSSDGDQVYDFKQIPIQVPALLTATTDSDEYFADAQLARVHVQLGVSLASLKYYDVLLIPNDATQDQALPAPEHPSFSFVWNIASLDAGQTTQLRVVLLSHDNQQIMAEKTLTLRKVIGPF